MKWESSKKNAKGERVRSSYAMRRDKEWRAMVKYVFAFNVQASYLFGCHCHVKYMQFKHIFEKPTCNHHPNRIHTHSHSLSRTHIFVSMKTTSTMTPCNHTLYPNHLHYLHINGRHKKQLHRNLASFLKGQHMMRKCRHSIHIGFTAIEQ